MENCIFCKIVKGEIPSYKIYEDNFTLAFLDISNDVLGHTLVIPKIHSTNLLDANIDTLTAVMNTVQTISNHYIKNCGFDGVNIISNNNESADQSVMHLHIHIFPRKKNDGLKIFPNIDKKNLNLEEVCQNLKVK